MRRQLGVMYTPPSARKTVVYLSRGDVASRRVSNEDKLLQEINWKIVSTYEPKTTLTKLLRVGANLEPTLLIRLFKGRSL
eukprot:8940235-Pyramimonas_sp.AAC.2